MHVIVNLGKIRIAHTGTYKAKYNIIMMQVLTGELPKIIGV